MWGRSFSPPRLIQRPSPLIVICHRGKFCFRIYPRGISEVPKRLHCRMVSTSKTVLKVFTVTGKVLNSEVWGSFRVFHFLHFTSLEKSYTLRGTIYLYRQSIYYLYKFVVFDLTDMQNWTFTKLISRACTDLWAAFFRQSAGQHLQAGMWILSVPDSLSGSLLLTNRHSEASLTTGQRNLKTPLSNLPANSWGNSPSEAQIPLTVSTEKGTTAMWIP